MRPVPSLRSFLFVTVLVVRLSAGFSPALAADQSRPAGRFDHLTQHLEGGAISGMPNAVGRLEASDSLRIGWEEFQSRHGVSWRVHVDERTGMPALAAGRGIVWFDEQEFQTVKPEEVEARARQFLAENQALLGDWSGLLELDHDATFRARNGHWQLVFRQVVDGVRVENARLGLHLKRGKLVMLGASHWGVPTTNGVPTLDSEQARESLDTYLGVPSASFEQVGKPELVLVALDANPALGEPRAWSGERGAGLRHALIWRISFREAGAPATWVGEVDAHDGSIRSFYDGTEYAAVRGGVFPLSSDGDCATGGCELPRFPMPYADYTEAGQPEEFADAFGNLMCDVGTASLETNLKGPYVEVADVCGFVLESGTCDEGLDLGMKHGENCDVAPGSSAGNTSAARTAYYHINRTAEVARFYDADNTWLENRLTVNVNIASSCNATWDGLEVNMYGAGSNCRNTAELATVLVHEWGHGYDHNDGGGRDNPSEGYADISMVLAARDSCMARGIYNDGSVCEGWGNPCLTCTGFRDFDWTAREWNTPATPVGWAGPQCPADSSQFGGACNRQPHCESYIGTEAIYDLATRDLPASGMDQDSAWQLVERLWYETRPGSGGDAYFCHLPLSDSCGETTWYQKMRVADDDDGDLSNGTPHAAELFAAFARHDIACGEVDDPANQSTSSCPALDAPVLTATELPGGTELTWVAVSGAAEYRVYRGELGCNRQQVPIASLTGGETSFLDTEADPGLPRFYRVEAFGSNPACFSPVSNCEASPPGALLNHQDHRVDDSDHDSDGMPEPGETFKLPVTLFNTGVESSMATNARLSLIGPSQVRVLGPDATWTDIPPSAMLESNDPHFEVTVLEDAACGDVLTLTYDAWAANAGPITKSLEFPMGDAQRDFLKTTYVSIPPVTTEPATSTQDIDDDQTIAELDFSIFLDNHQDPTQLIVELTSPEGTTVRVHDGSAGSGTGIDTRYDLLTAPDGPGTMADFVGESTQGTWTVSVEDVDSDGPTNNARLLRWTLHTTVTGAFDCQVKTCPEPAPTEAPDLTVDTAANGSETDLVFSWDPVAGAAGYHVLQSTSAAFDTSVELLGRTTTETTHTVADGVNTTPDLTFLQVRGTNSCNQEGP